MPAGDTARPPPPAPGHPHPPHRGPRWYPERVRRGSVADPVRGPWGTETTPGRWLRHLILGDQPLASRLMLVFLGQRGSPLLLPPLPPPPISSVRPTSLRYFFFPCGFFFSSVVLFVCLCSVPQHSFFTLLFNHHLSLLLTPLSFSGSTLHSTTAGQVLFYFRFDFILFETASFTIDEP
jgi:hypothetical protein